MYFINVINTWGGHLYYPDCKERETCRFNWLGRMVRRKQSPVLEAMDPEADGYKLGVIKEDEQGISQSDEDPADVKTNPEGKRKTSSIIRGQPSRQPVIDIIAFGLLMVVVANLTNMAATPRDGNQDKTYNL